jgi:hypothetical protein
VLPAERRDVLEQGRIDGLGFPKQSERHEPHSQATPAAHAVLREEVECTVLDRAEVDAELLGLCEALAKAGRVRA